MRPVLLLVLALEGCSFDQGDEDPSVPPGSSVHCPGRMVCDQAGHCRCGSVARPELDASALELGPA
jgi:hypothetical protein